MCSDSLYMYFTQISMQTAMEKKVQFQLVKEQIKDAASVFLSIYHLTNLE